MIDWPVKDINTVQESMINEYEFSQQTCPFILFGNYNLILLVDYRNNICSVLCLKILLKYI